MNKINHLYAKLLQSFFFLSVLSLISGVSYGFAQTHMITGFISDKSSGQPLPTVHVYISQTTSGTVSDENGEFSFETDLSGSHQLVFSFIGYQTEMTDLNLSSASSTHHVEIEMDPEAFELEALEVRASNREWQQNFNQFRRHFLGTTRFALESDIINPWVVDIFRDDDGHLIAASDQPLYIVNHSLGYQLHIDLVEFRWDRSGVTGFYTYYSRFRELESESNRQQQEWTRNREQAYRGSFNHFLKSLFDDMLSENRFEIVAENTSQRIELEELNRLEMRRFSGYSPVSGSESDGFLKGYRLQYPVDVLYGRATRIPDNRLRSRLVPRNNSGVFMVTERGKLYDPVSIRVDGAWSYERVGNLLPDDYSPGNLTRH